MTTVTRRLPRAVVLQSRTVSGFTLTSLLRTRATVCVSTTDAEVPPRPSLNNILHQSVASFYLIFNSFLLRT